MNIEQVIDVSSCVLLACEAAAVFHDRCRIFPKEYKMKNNKS